MNIEHVAYSDFCSFLEARVKDRMTELIKEMQGLEYIKRDRGLFPYERARYNSLGAIFKINEEIMRTLDPKYSPIQ